MNSFYMCYKDARLKEGVHLRITEDLKGKLDREKEKRGLDLSSTIRSIISESLSNRSEENGQTR